MVGLDQLLARIELSPQWALVETTEVDEVASLIAEIDDTVDVVGLDRIDDVALLRLERERVRRVGPRSVVFVGRPGSGARLATLVPHIWSLIGPDLFVDEDDPAALVEQRLASYRQERRWTDAEVIEAAERGNLPPDPVFAEWLVLLGRGELLR